MYLYGVLVSRLDDFSGTLVSFLRVFSATDEVADRHPACQQALSADAVGTADVECSAHVVRVVRDETSTVDDDNLVNHEALVEQAGHQLAPDAGDRSPAGTVARVLDARADHDGGGGALHRRAEGARLRGVRLATRQLGDDFRARDRRRLDLETADGFARLRQKPVSVGANAARDSEVRHVDVQLVAELVQLVRNSNAATQTRARRRTAADAVDRQRHAAIGGRLLESAAAASGTRNFGAAARNLRRQIQLGGTRSEEAVRHELFGRLSPWDRRLQRRRHVYRTRARCPTPLPKRQHCQQRIPDSVSQQFPG